jgi:Protein of unknown function (DUF1353)
MGMGQNSLRILLLWAYQGKMTRESVVGHPQCKTPEAEMSIPEVEDVMPYPLSVCPANAKSWVLLEDFLYKDGDTSVTVPRGFETDFASIPRFLWQLLPQWGLYGWAAVVHDYLYSAQTMPRWRADRILGLDHRVGHFRPLRIIAKVLEPLVLPIIRCFCLAQK